MAEVFNKNCFIDTNQQLGRYVRAKEKLSPGELVLLEKPIVIMAASGEKRCNNCFKYAQSYCGLCKITNLCSTCLDHNQYDCNLLASMTNVDWTLLKQHSDCYAIIKCLLLRENPATKQQFELMLQSESHLDKRRDTQVWTNCNENIIGPLLKSGLVHTLSCSEQINENLLQHICTAIDVNGFEIRAPDSGSMRAIYINGALLSHDCTANTQLSIDDNFCMKIYASHEINKGALITNCYTNVLLPKDDSQRESKYCKSTKINKVKIDRKKIGIFILRPMPK